MKRLVPVLFAALPLVAQVTIARGDYHGWKNAVTMRNRAAVVTVVPSIGRVMRFSLLDDKGAEMDGPLWNNRALDGKPADPASKVWVNFGGDKSWPAEQAEWPQITGRAWPPPPAFDSAPDTVDVGRKSVTLTSGVDGSYGIRERRVITLDPVQPVMTIRTTYDKVRGGAVRTAVWTITQLESPDEAWLARPATSRFSAGFRNMGDSPPYRLAVEKSVVRVQRDPEKSTKIGTDGDRLTWNGGGVSLQIDRLAGDDGAAPDWADGGCRVEVYTNPDGEGLKYVELETVGPRHTMLPGDSIAGTVRYKLARRAAGAGR